jgi:predicted nucleotidyltransferase
MKFYQIEKEYFILQMMNNSRLELMEQLEELFTIEKISFIWNNSNKNEFEFYSLIFDYLQAKSKKDEFIRIKFNNLIKYFNL